MMVGHEPHAGGEGMSEHNKDKPGQTYYASTPEHEARLHRLVTLRIKNAMLYEAYYNKGRVDDSHGLFDIVQPEDEADCLIADLRLFGLIPAQHPDPRDGGEENG